MTKPSKGRCLLSVPDPALSFLVGWRDFWSSVGFKQPVLRGGPCIPAALWNTEVLLKSCVDTALRYRRLLMLIKTYTPHMLLTFNLNGTPSMSYLYFTCPYGIRYKPKSSSAGLSMCTFFLPGI